MKAGQLHLVLFSWLFVLFHASAATLYVNLNSTNPVPPYADWSTAATNIQDAIDAATDGDLILVTNGVYQTGGRVVYGSLTNRVVINKAVTVQSVNGPAVTVIQGNPAIGDSAVRCAYLTNSASLIGFTLTSGATRSGGDLNHEECGGGVWCESSSASILNCIVSSNVAEFHGSGADGGTLSNCFIMGNSAVLGDGGGAIYATLNYCTLTGNSSQKSSGGGAIDCTLNDCVLSNNSAATIGGGAVQGTLNNCLLIGNSAASQGGGAWNSPLNNCSISGNSALYGGGAYQGTLNNCTLTGNSAFMGGGANSAKLNNCIVYYNSASGGANYYGCTLNFCCTTPLAAGTGNITNEPVLTDLSHISANSPCIGAGSTNYSTGLDIDGEPWANPPSIGCDEYNPGAIGSLSVVIDAYTNLAAGFAANFTGQIVGHADSSVWDFGDGSVVSNSPYASHSWLVSGVYLVTLRVFNDNNPAGVSATSGIQVVRQPMHYVSPASTNPVWPFTNWGTAATNIQDAVDAAYLGATVLVSNGVYGVGGRLVYGSTTNRLAVTKPVTVQSVNGPAVTVIQGSGGGFNGINAARCVYLSNGAMLVGFTLTNGVTASSGDTVLSESGGGVWCESSGVVVSNCVLAHNLAYMSGGGAYSGTLNNCMVISNLAGGSSHAGQGGAGCSNVMNNCLIIYNQAGPDGSGVAQGSALTNCTVCYNGTTAGDDAEIIRSCTLRNCILFYNFYAYNYVSYNGNDLKNCCIAPMSVFPFNYGVNNITNAPLFINSTNDFHLQSNSPCINSGNDAYVSITNDLDGNPRIVGGTVDIGAYEYQNPSSVISYAWLQQYGLPTDGSADYIDSDGTGMNNWQKWIAGLNPTNALSVLQMLPPASTNNPPGLIVSWQSVSNITYFLQSSTNLGVQPAFSAIQSNIVGQAGTTSYTDTTATNGGPYFYRVGVQ